MEPGLPAFEFIQALYRRQRLKLSVRSAFEKPDSHRPAGRDKRQDGNTEGRLTAILVRQWTDGEVNWDVFLASREEGPHPDRLSG